MARNLLALIAFAFGFFGLWAMISPTGMVALLGIGAVSPDAMADVRAMYGGMELTWAGILGWHALDDDRHRAGLYLATAAVGGIGTARLISELVSGGSALSIFLVVVELGATGVLWWFARQE